MTLRSFEAIPFLGSSAKQYSVVHFKHISNSLCLEISLYMEVIFVSKSKPRPHRCNAQLAPSLDVILFIPCTININIILEVRKYSFKCKMKALN